MLGGWSCRAERGAVHRLRRRRLATEMEYAERDLLLAATPHEMLPGRQFKSLVLRFALRLFVETCVCVIVYA